MAKGDGDILVIKGLILHGDRLVVYQDEVESKEVVSNAGVIEKLAVGPTTKASSGVVVNVAYDLDFGIGDRVLFSPYSGFALSYKGDGRYLLLGSHEVFGHYKGDVGDVEIR